MDWFRQVMAGRYGSDALGCTLLAAYFVLWLASRLFSNWVLFLLSLACVVWAFYRMLSRRMDLRHAENERFLELTRPILQRYNAYRCRRRDKEHCYFRCPNCGQQLRVPKGKGKISITCRSCGASFEEKT